MSAPAAVTDVRPFSYPQKLALVGEILTIYGRVRWWLWRRDLSGTVSALRSYRESVSVNRADEMSLHLHGLHLGRAVVRTLAVLPTDSRCLVRSLVLTAVLAKRGISSSLVIGVRTQPEFGAHAWVESGGQPLLPPGETVYQRLLEI